MNTKQRKQLSEMKYFAFVEVRILGWAGKAKQAADLADARAALEEVSGRRASEDLLAHIFERFCVGK